MIRTITIEGMTCGHCTATVEKALRALPNVTDVKVDLAAKTADVTINTDMNPEILATAVADTGFEVVSVT